MSDETKKENDKTSEQSRAEIAEALAGLAEVRSRTSLGGLDWRELRDEGRR